jgi:hypothetical protein
MGNGKRETGNEDGQTTTPDLFFESLKSINGFDLFRQFIRVLILWGVFEPSKYLSGSSSA